jgi:Ca2+-binding EF-hand superfamily protein
MIAVVTMSKYHFDNYLKKFGLKPTEAKQISVLSDIDNAKIEKVKFTSVVEIEGSDNVTDFVKKEIKVD